MILIDETSCAKGHSYISNVIDYLTGDVIYCTEGNDSTILSSLRYWLIHHNFNPEDICVICCDMSRSYIKGIEGWFPNASICFDKFHVVKHANEMVDNVRRKVGLKSKHGKGLRYGFTMNREDLEKTSGEYREMIDNTLRTYSDLGKVYAVKEALRDFYSLGNPEYSKYFLRSFIIYCKNSGLEDVRSLGGMLESLRWYPVLAFVQGLQWCGRRPQQCHTDHEGHTRGYVNVDNMISMVCLKSTLDYPSILSNPFLIGI